MKRFGYAIAVLLVFGLVKLPFESRLTGEFRAAHFHSTQLNLSVRQQVGQMGFIAALSGFRSVIADGLWLEAYIAWENTQWGKMKVLFDAVTTLQPRAMMFWDMAGYHMAYNASVAALRDDRQPREALRIRARDEYYRLGEDYYLKGVQYNPDHAYLYERLGIVYRDKFEDHAKAAWAFFEAAARPDAMAYVHRFAVYQLEKCPGHERQAYDMLVALYHEGKQERVPTLLTDLDELQNKLQIPPAERINIAEDLREATPH